MKICFCLCCNVATCHVALSTGPVHGNKTLQGWSISASSSHHKAPQHASLLVQLIQPYLCRRWVISLSAKSFYAYWAPPDINSAPTNCTSTLFDLILDTLPSLCYTSGRWFLSKTSFYSYVLLKSPTVLESEDTALWSIPRTLTFTPFDMKLQYFPMLFAIHYTSTPTPSNPFISLFP